VSGGISSEPTEFPGRGCGHRRVSSCSRCPSPRSRPSARAARSDSTCRPSPSCTTSEFDRYVGRFQPETSWQVGAWTEYRFDTQDGEGPLCLDGTPFAVDTRVRDPSRVVVYFTGGGACWSGMPSCAARVSATPSDDTGIFADSYQAESGEPIENPLAEWSMMVVGNCDGSFFGGDNDVPDPSFTWGRGVRHYRGVRNATAALDLAHQLFPLPDKVLLAGTSAGAYGVLGLVPLIARFVRSGSEGHAILPYDAFYQAEIHGVPLQRWMRNFVEEDPDWSDLVEEWIPVP
jgi:hypothetical protein